MRSFFDRLAKLNRGPRSRPLVGTGGISAEGLPAELGGAGEVIRDANPRGFNGRITGRSAEFPAGNCYAFIRADDASPDTFPEVEDGTFGDGDAENGVAAFERSGNTSVPIDGTVVVFLEPLAAGTVGYSFSYTGTSSPALAYATIALGSGGFDITEANAVWENTGLTLSLPSAGTYLLEGVATAFALLSVAAPGGEVGIGVRLYDDTTGQGIPGSESRIVSVEGDFGLQFRTGPIRALPYVVDSARVVRLQAYRFISPGRGGTWGSSSLHGQEGLEFPSSYTSGPTHFGYLKIG